MGIMVRSVALAVSPHPEACITGSASVTDEQERSADTMDEQEKWETTEAEKQYSEAGKKHAEAERLYAEAEKQYADTMEASKQAGVKRREEAEQRRAEEEAEQQANEAAKQFADAVRASYLAVADRSISAQALNAQLTQQFLNSVINNLRGQAEDNRPWPRSWWTSSGALKRLAKHSRRSPSVPIWTSLTPYSPSTRGACRDSRKRYQGDRQKQWRRTS